VRPGVALVVASMLTSACVASGSAEAGPGLTLRLRAGESAQAADGAVRVGFDAVTADSRCPRGEQCVQAGDATVRVWLEYPAGPRQTFLLRTAPGPAQAARGAAHELRLLRLEPEPVSRRATAAREVTATLRLSRGPGADPER